MSTTLKDFISKLPIEKIGKIRLYPNKIIFPVVIDANKFYKDFSASINTAAFTDEKALYVASQYDHQEYINYSDLLNSKLRYA